MLKVSNPDPVAEEIFCSVLQVLRWGSGELRTAKALVAQFKVGVAHVTVGAKSRLCRGQFSRLPLLCQHLLFG